MILLAFIAGLVAMGALVWARARFWSFRGQKLDFHAEEEPKLDIREAFNGPILSEGFITDPLGRVTSRFTADMTGTWNGNSGTLEETFRFSGGTEQERCWSLEVSDGGRITATAPDVIGPGGGAQRGPCVRLTYRIKLSEEAGGHVLDVTDWLYLCENGVLLNRSQFRKFGVTVAELFATMRRAP